MGIILNTNERSYPKELDSRIEFCYTTITAVLVLGEIGDYAVYVGNGSPEWIARHGDKISFKEASCHFPGIKEEKYRL